MKTLIFILTITLLAISCNQPKKEKSYSLVKAWSTDTLLRTPESACYDAERDIIFVANINSGPWDKDGNGFISKINKHGEILELEWVTGLNAPKGMGVYDGKLYVADVDELVIIDISNAEITEKVLFEGAHSLNDLSVDASGKVFISDSRDNIIYTWFEGEYEIWLNEGFEKSNGLLCEEDRLLLASSDFNAIDYETKEITLINDSISSGDGIAAIGDGYYFVSEWPGEVFLIKPDNSIMSVLNTREAGISSADIDYIKKDSLLLVPTFFTNTIEAYKLSVK